MRESQNHNAASTEQNCLFTKMKKKKNNSTAQRCGDATANRFLSAVTAAGSFDSQRKNRQIAQSGGKMEFKFFQKKDNSPFLSSHIFLLSTNRCLEVIRSRRSGPKPNSPQTVFATIAHCNAITPPLRGDVLLFKSTPRSQQQLSNFSSLRSKKGAAKIPSAILVTGQQKKL